jgi:hypothetical protein
MNRFVTFFVIILLGSGMTQVALAEATCKGLTEKACGDAAHCAWVKPYVTKAGKEIKGYCRNKAAKKEKPSADTPDDKKPEEKKASEKK